MAINTTLKKEKTGTDTTLALMLGAAQNSVQQIPVEHLQPYPNQPFRLYGEEQMTELCQSIQAEGVLSPVLVRRMDSGYQILSGHNRTNAAKQVGLSTVPCIEVQADDDRAAWIVATTNLQQRQQLLPSEKAFAYRMQYEATKKQGKRNDLTSSKVWTKSDNVRSDMGIAVNERCGRSTIHNYIALTKLCPPLLNMVDEKCIPLVAGFHLAKILEAQQLYLVDFLVEHDIKKISLEQAKLIALNETTLYSSLSDIFQTTSKPKPMQVKLSLPYDYLHTPKAKVKPDEELLRKIAAVIDAHYAEETLA